MTFTRTSDDSELAPLIVFGPYENGTPARNIVRQLLESSEVRTTYVPAALRNGNFQCLFDDYSDAYVAWQWFKAASTYTFEGPATTAGEYIIVDGVIVLSAGEPDPAFALTFAVADGELRIVQNEKWELYVPFREVSS